MVTFYIILSILYLLLVAACIFSWLRTPVFNPVNLQPETYITVIIPARNEASVILLILNDLKFQFYPKHLYEVIVVDDCSDDKTDLLVRESMDGVLNLKLIRVKEYPDLKGKKAAVLTGIKEAKGSFIITLDADCRVGKKHLILFESFYKQYNLKMVTGPVAFKDSGTFLNDILSIEFSSLIGTGMATLKMGVPTMCNGANLAYEKDAFFSVGGFEGNESVASGDDEFLYHKICNRYPGGVKFLKNAEAIAYTSAPNTISEFFNQRKRWSSKWNHYKDKRIILLAIFVFSYNLITLVMSCFWLSGAYTSVVFLMPFFLKISVEFVFLRLLVKFSNNRINTGAFMILEIIYPFYVSFFGIFSKWGKYNWKGRQLK